MQKGIVMKCVKGSVVNLLSGLFLGLMGVTAVYADTDIRVESALGAGGTHTQYSIGLSDCDDLVSVALATDESQVLTRSQFRPSRNEGCEATFSIGVPDFLTPEVVISFLNDSSTYSERYYHEDVLPSISLNEVSISGDAALSQSVNVSLDVADNNDVSFVEFSIKGLRASALRAAGGVVDIASETAFLDESLKLYPSPKNPNAVYASFPLQSLLTADIIAHDSLVLIEATVFDASGNKRHLSKLEYLGQDVNEEVTGFSVSPKKVVFTNLLEAAQIIPTISYTFRGDVPSPGAGQGVTYTSADPAVVLVTESGVIYPLDENIAAPVDIQVSFGGVYQETISVELDVNKELVGLKLKDLDKTNGLLTLAGLNEYFDIPDLIGILRDNKNHLDRHAKKKMTLSFIDYCIATPK